MADGNATTDICQFVGDARPDIAGLGILIGFSGQAFLSLCLALWVFFFSRHGRLDMLHEDDSDEHEIETKRLEMVQDILMIGNDIQLMMGLALMITVFSSYKEMDLYHFRLIYDIVSFVGVSIAAALVCFTFCLALKEKYHRRRQRRATGLAMDDDDEENNKSRRRRYTLQPARKLLKSVARTLPLLFEFSKKNPTVRKFAQTGRYRVTYMFAGFFVALTVLLDTKLTRWDLEVPGECYNTSGTSAPGARQPYADRVYVWVTFGWMMSVMLFSVFSGTAHRHYILAAAFVQFPLHLYMMITLRTANQGLLGVTADSDSADAEDADDGPENEWDFGQTTAILLLGVAVVESISKGREFYAFEREIKKKRRATEEREAREARRQGGGGGGGDDRDDRDELDEGALLDGDGNAPPSPWKQRSDALVTTVSSSLQDGGGGTVSSSSRPYDVEAAGPLRGHQYQQPREPGY